MFVIEYSRMKDTLNFPANDERIRPRARWPTGTYRNLAMQVADRIAAYAEFSNSCTNS